MMTMNMDGSDEVQIYINCRCINIQNKVTYSAELAWVLRLMSRRRSSSSNNQRACTGAEVWQRMSWKRDGR